MTPRLILVRHGASAHVHRGGLLAAPDVNSWRDAYDLAGITDASLPPDTLLRRAADVDHIIASDMPRAVASAERIARGRIVQTTPLLREIPLAIPRLPVRLPLMGWGMAIHLAWMYRTVRGRHTPSDERSRIAQAVAWLTEVTGPRSSLVVTHGVFRSALAKELLLAGWVSDGRRGGYSHWSEWTFVLPSTT